MKLKLLFLVLSFLLLFTFDVNSQILLIEDFNYPAGDSIGAHGWVYFSGTVNNIMVVSPGLTYTGYSGSGIGNAAYMKNNGNDNYKALSVNDSTGNLYVSFMVKIDSAKTGDYFLAMLPSTSITNYTARVFVKDSLGVLYFGLCKSAASANNPLVYSNVSFQYNTTYLIVLRFRFIASSTTDDDMSLFVFTSPNLPGTEPATPTVGPVTGTATDPANLGRVALRQGSSSSASVLSIDGIKICKSWTQMVSLVKQVSSFATTFSLSQNYPNPFNPSTNINFSIPDNGYVSLKIFDILGRELKQLVGNVLTAGTYQTEFSGSGFNSGIYYYRLDFSSAKGQYSDTKKLMLIK